MAARGYIAFFALLAFATTSTYATSSAYAQKAVIYVDVANKTHEKLVAIPGDDLYRMQLADELHLVKDEALLLYTDYASRAGNDVKIFMNNITGYADEVIRSNGVDPTINYSDECTTKFVYHLKKIEHDARRAATYSGDSHHKFLLGHMVVFRMHINKSEDYLKKYEKVYRDCGLPCETTSRMKRWRRLAIEEIHRVKDDIQHSKKSYRDLVSHARRKLNHLKKQALSSGRDAINEYYNCIRY